MLILQRKPGESLRIGENIIVSVLAVENGRVRLAIDAPNEIPILRSELIAAQAANREAVVADPAAADELLALLDGMPEPPAHGKE